MAPHLKHIDAIVYQAIISKKDHQFFAQNIEWLTNIFIIVENLWK